jgi:hypothetical protein
LTDTLSSVAALLVSLETNSAILCGSLGTEWSRVMVQHMYFFLPPQDDHTKLLPQPVPVLFFGFLPRKQRKVRDSCQEQQSLGVYGTAKLLKKTLRE